MAWQKQAPKNIEVSVEEGMIVIRIHPEQRFGPSESGKTMIVAKGSVEVPGMPGMGVSLTAYTKGE
jgi:hypothetical protein